MKKIVLALLLAAGFAFGAVMSVEDMAVQKGASKLVDENGKETWIDKDGKPIKDLKKFAGSDEKSPVADDTKKQGKKSKNSK